jgi:hypothetical protein
VIWSTLQHRITLSCLTMHGLKRRCQQLKIGLEFAVLLTSLCQLTCCQSPDHMCSSVRLIPRGIPPRSSVLVTRNEARQFVSAYGGRSETRSTSLLAARLCLWSDSRQHTSTGGHGLSCRKSVGRLHRHSAISELIKRALMSAAIPLQLEPIDLTESAE